MASRSGYSAECLDCPESIGVDYGEPIRMGVQSINQSHQAKVEVAGWAEVHWSETGHNVRFTNYCTIEFSLVENG